jgi:dienelactone hydrolase
MSMGMSLVYHRSDAGRAVARLPAVRTLEIALAVTTTIALLLPLVSRSRGPALALSTAAVVVGVAHAVVEGWRWQLVPLYALVSGLVLWRLARARAPRAERRRLLPAIAGLMVVTVTSALAVALPVPPLPTHRGPLAVGTTSWELGPDGREDPYRGGLRQLVAQAWYPTDEPGAPSPWITDAGALSAAVAPEVGLPGFALQHVGLVEVDATLDVPLSAGEWPVVVYSHGWSGFRTVHSNLAESLASNGIVVLALDHSSGASVSLFPDGRTIPLDPSANPDEAVVGAEARQERIELLEQTFAEDVAALLDQLSRGIGPARLLQGEGRLQLDQVGLTGHSTGGGAMIRLCITDDRCAGVLGLDPWVVPIPEELREEGVDAALLSIRSEDWQGNDNDGLLRALHEDSPGDEGLFVIPGTRHRDFTLQPFLTPLAAPLGLSGDADVRAVHRAVDEMALDFFRRHLEGAGGDQVVPAPIEAD